MASWCKVKCEILGTKFLTFVSVTLICHNFHYLQLENSPKKARALIG